MNSYRYASSGFGVDGVSIANHGIHGDSTNCLENGLRRFGGCRAKVEGGGSGKIFVKISSLCLTRAFQGEVASCHRRVQVLA
jgi:hypothetical protein